MTVNNNIFVPSENLLFQKTQMTQSSKNPEVIGVKCI